MMNSLRLAPAVRALCRTLGLASPTIENSNRLLDWLREMDKLRRVIGAAA
jgi:hypothetical protein